MIPEFWALPAAGVFATVIMALVTGGNPGMIITDEGIEFAVEYPRERR